ncbi:PASTA domain-containing protein [Bifidobacterium sp. SMB2]|uniref:non-specific serine/threonine protein kinase n=1 Tax=Bifidobacterium saimiriisciurei TaxID=2661627 RepID=A0ABX0CCA5_9BIFI|nr:MULTISPECIES: PASTA domain-containing protein [Bifidobacterium]NEG95829.1 PASTA domain-containing protein [Bifidobacterium sp. SMB2]NEH12102.1 PASTA domain-containing protein [Bifidobacterium saimiriisciurei]
MSEVTGAPIGNIIDNRYRITRKIAEGGMATVYQATDIRLDRSVAIKIMHIQLAQGPHRDQFVQRFHREARSAAAIANPHIVQIYDTGEYDGLDYLVMEYVHGVNLRYEMNRVGTFSVRETIRIIGEILDGLAAAHGVGVVHRDIKPENILLNDRGRVQITDFGLAKAASQATLATTGMLLGTAAYLAPEMIEDNLATPQGDLYSVGIMAWEMLAGEVPFTSDNPVTMVFKHVHEDVPALSAQHPGMPRPVSEFIARLTGRRVSDRPDDATQALRELQDFSRSLTPTELAYRIGDGPQPQPTSVLPVSGIVPAAREDESAPLATEVIGDEATDTATSGSPEAVAGKPRRRLAIVLCVVAAVAAMAAGGFAWWYYLGPGSYWTVPSADDVACTQGQTCSIKGAKFADYERTLKVTGIPYTTSEEFSDTAKKGTIISASPSNVGDHVSKRNNDVMTFVISKGVRQLTIPADIADSGSANGKDPIGALEKIGFTSIAHDTSKDEYSMDVPEGAIISIDPEPGSTVNHNRTVTVVLSKGPMPVSMPDVVGRTKADAISMLGQARLKVTTSETYSDTVAAGKVISSSVRAGTQLHWGDSVSLVVSKGPQMVTVPDVRGKSQDEATKTLKALGLNVKVSAPLGNLTHTVRLQDPAPGKQVRVRDAKGNATTVTLTVV